MDLNQDPFAIFAQWYERAQHCGLSEPAAMTVATADASGMPSARMMLLKGFDAEGFVFYTNLGSQKARELRENPQAALCFHWMPLERQVRVQGRVRQVDAAEADAYFASRPRKSRIGAWASKQSQPLEGRFELEARVARFAARYAVGEVPRPEFWSGFRLRPQSIEFWEQRGFRLHERTRFIGSEDGWRGEHLFP
ncbi:MAG: pyridoxamine 5'-phosphate oxidase [Myxococcales bacterium]|nr:pyridoxamine 5'-phosphate oxidase [Myxococcales bacterium]